LFLKKLIILKKKHDSYFDGSEYTETMVEIYDDCYQLPHLEDLERTDAKGKIKNSSDQPFDVRETVVKNTFFN